MNRNDVIKTLLPLLEYYSFNDALIKQLCDNLNVTRELLWILFPNQIDDLVLCIYKQTYIDILNDMQGSSIKEQVFNFLKIHFKNLDHNKTSMLKLIQYLQHHPYKGLQLSYSFVDMIWCNIQHMSSNMSFYTRRLSLQSLYINSLCYFTTHSLNQTLNFIKKQVDIFASLGKFKYNIKNKLTQFFS